MLKEKMAVLIGLSSSCCLAWSWPSYPRSHQQLLITVNTDLLTAVRVYKLNNIPTYQKVFHKKRYHHFSQAQKSKPQGAISMTLCELATARHHSPPLECSAFADSRIPFVSTSHVQGDCVERWNDIGTINDLAGLKILIYIPTDTAKDIYRNATLEKISLIRFMLGREKAMKDVVQSWERTSEDLRNIIIALSDSSGRIRSSADVMVSRMEDSIHKILSHVDREVLDLQDRHNDASLKSTMKIHNLLEEISLRHADSLSMLLPNFQDSLTSQLQLAFLPVLERSHQALENLNHAHQQWGILENEFTAMQYTFGELATAISQITVILDKSTEQAILAQKTQQEVTSSAVDLVDTLSRLTATTREELIAINNTAAALKHELRHNNSNEWLRVGAASLMQTFLPNVPNLSYLLTPRWVRLILGLASALWYLLQTGFSILTSAFMVLYSKQVWSQFPDLSASTKEQVLREAPPPPLSSVELHQSVYEPKYCQYIHRDPRIVRRSSRPRMSRIPDRLCKAPSEQARMWI
ncbi:hypothetical protein SERLADRAFT_412890 [Serpula lacrymans var. lacrymans S7.9]|uniref:Karyogamy protein 5 n=1 Tax=Serpula lacrymans var. lacrymans (strain S7.9) TaxID=578457 RepID=F8NGG5_SERL9|nr:uncharacterized protein SERLADRAFT_412890 [Serpula lacrymans var. lacrymans S7.9]EGO29352.1 hypothetical protein SERLADRAFT_412890 [Serpula lacrymans var. lacrymans S7.9]